MSFLASTRKYRLRVALFGSSNSGKSLFRKMLLTGKYGPTRSNRHSIEKEIPRTYNFEVKITGNIGKVDYILHLIDIPGRQNLAEEREKALGKINGYIFFYDSTDVRSIELLEEMIKKELEEKKKMKSALAIILVGTKKDKGPNEEAIKKACQLVDYLSRITMPHFGYKVPHLLICCKNKEEVDMVLRCLESIMFEMKPSKKVIDKIGIIHKQTAGFVILEPLEGLEEISRIIETMAKKTTISTTIPPHITPSVTTEKPPSIPTEPAVKPPKHVEIEDMKLEFKPFQNPKIWNLAKAVKVLFPGIQECLIINKKKDGYYIAHSKEKKITQQQKKTLAKIIELLRVSDTIGKFDTISLNGEEESIIIFKGEATVILRKKQSPKE